MLKLIYSFLFSFIILFAFAQEQQQNLWLFGTGTKGVSFDPITHQPTIITGKYSPYGAEGCGVATKPSTGELLFYSDGIRVVDANNQVMPNGSGLLGNSSSAQNAWVCGMPGTCNQYYVFSSAGEKGSNPSGGLYYSNVDMSLPGNGTSANPKGDVVATKKNILINATGSEALTLIKSANQGEYWLLSIVHGTKQIRIYKITISGITLFATHTGAYTYNDPRNIRYSEKAQKFCITSMYELDPALIGDFNPATGTISSLSPIPGTPLSTGSNAFSGFYDSEWSPDATKLYLTRYRNYNANSGGSLYQYNLSNPTANIALIFNVGGVIGNAMGGLKVAPDGKLYVAYNSPTDGTRYVSRIENPNDPPASIIFTPKAIDFGVGNPVFFKFPEFMIFDNHKPLAVNDDQTSICISQPTDITVLANDTDPDNNILSATVIKTYKGTSTLNANGTVHYIPLTGYIGNDTIWYTACDNACVSLCDTAYVLICNPRVCSNDPPVAVTDVVPCFYTSLTMTIDVLKNDSDPDHDSIYISSVQATNGTAIIYRDTLIQFKANPGFSGTATITYTVCDTSTCNTNNCTQISFDLCVEPPLPPICVNNLPIPATDVFACIYDSSAYVLLDVLKNDTDPDSDPLYIPSAYLYAENGYISVLDDTLLMYTPKPGFSGNDVISYLICDGTTCSNGCVTASVTLCVLSSPIKIPNLFTPNGDNHNEVFFIEGLYPNTKVSIYNRWGELVYETSNYDNSWGRSDKVTDGLYYCQIVDAIRGKTYKSWVQVLGRK